MTFKSPIILKRTTVLITVLLTTSPLGCGDDDGDPAPLTSSLFAFSNDDSRWLISQLTPDGRLHKAYEISALADRTTQKAQETSTEDLGPGWGDAITSPNGRWIFVNARNADALVVLDAASANVEQIYEFDWGDRPVHIYNPNHGDEIWTHLDGKGSFFVVNAETLEVVSGLDRLVPGTNPQVGTGHGKLIYSEANGDAYYATNTAEPAVFAIDGDAKSMTSSLAVCGVAPTDDPATPEDESTGPLEGGTHDKAYLAGNGLFVFQCTRGAGFAFVDPNTNSVVADRVSMAGSLTSSPNGDVVLCINNNLDRDQVQVWEAADGEDNGHDIDWTASVGGEASARGTHFRQVTGGRWEAWIPQTEGLDVAILDIDTRQQTTVSVGPLTAPDGASHFSRRGAMGTAAFYTHNDDGIVRISFETRTVSAATPVDGNISRMAFVDATL